MAHNQEWPGMAWYAVSDRSAGWLVPDETPAGDLVYFCSAIWYIEGDTEPSREARTTSRMTVCANTSIELMSFTDFLKIYMKKWTQQKITLVYEIWTFEAVWGVYGNGDIVISEAQSKVETFDRAKIKLHLSQNDSFLKLQYYAKSLLPFSNNNLCLPVNSQKMRKSILYFFCFIHLSGSVC